MYSNIFFSLTATDQLANNDQTHGGKNSFDLEIWAFVFHSLKVRVLKIWLFEIWHFGSLRAIRVAQGQKNTVKCNMSSVVRASSMYSHLCIKMSYFLFVLTWAMQRILNLSCGIPIPGLEHLESFLVWHQYCCCRQGKKSSKENQVIF